MIDDDHDDDDHDDDDGGGGGDDAAASFAYNPKKQLVARAKSWALLSMEAVP